MVWWAAEMARRAKMDALPYPALTINKCNQYWFYNTHFNFHLYFCNFLKKYFLNSWFLRIKISMIKSHSALYDVDFKAFMCCFGWRSINKNDLLYIRKIFFGCTTSVYIGKISFSLALLHSLPLSILTFGKNLKIPRRVELNSWWLYIRIDLHSFLKQ